MTSSIRDPGPVRPADAYLPQRRECILAGRCVTCSAEDLQDESFRDDKSRSEYRISGMCQACQDEVFPDNARRSGRQ